MPAIRCPSCCHRGVSFGSLLRLGAGQDARCKRCGQALRLGAMRRARAGLFAGWVALFTLGTLVALPLWASWLYLIVFGLPLFPALAMEALSRIEPVAGG